MGYVYTKSGSLCCDVCCKAGARKSSCPYGYCPAIACCANPACREDLKKHRQDVCHINCKRLSAEWKAQLEKRQKRLNAGEYLRTSAISVGWQRIKVTFTNKSGDEKILCMSSRVYHSFKLGNDVSIEEFVARENSLSSPLEVSP